jgi:hypothetical protein
MQLVFSSELEAIAVEEQLYFVKRVGKVLPILVHDLGLSTFSY